MTRGVFLCLLAALAVGAPALAQASRPLEGEGPTQVRISIFVLDVDEINTASQSFDANVYVEYRWRDPRAVGGGSDNVTRSLHDIWHPRILFVNLQRQKERKFHYALRAVTVGDFILPPVAAEAMYDPAKSSVANSGRVKVIE